MALRDFHSSDTKARVTAQVKAIEARTCAEVVVVVRTRSDPHRDVAWICGTLLALGTLVALRVLPDALSDWAFFVDVALGFAVGAFAGSRSAWLQRLVTSPRRRREVVARAAAAAFLAQGIHRTRRRCGLLVYASLHEREVAVLLDAGLDSAVGALQGATATLSASLRGGLSVSTFVAALAALAAPLSAARPEVAGQENELPDAPVDDAGAGA